MSGKDWTPRRRSMRPRGMGLVSPIDDGFWRKCRAPSESSCPSSCLPRPPRQKIAPRNRVSVSAGHRGTSRTQSGTQGDTGTKGGQREQKGNITFYWVGALGFLEGRLGQTEFQVKLKLGLDPQPCAYGRLGSRSATAIRPTSCPPMVKATDSVSPMIVGGGYVPPTPAPVRGGHRLRVASRLR